MVSSKDICIEDQRIKVVKQWPKPQLVQDIQVFFGFANFYQQLIQGFNRIAAPLTSMLKTPKSIESKIQPGEGGVGNGDNSRAGHDKSEIDGSGIDNVEVDGNEVEFDKIGKKVQKSSKSKNSSKIKKTEWSSDFLTPGAKLAFTKLR